MNNHTSHGKPIGKWTKKNSVKKKIFKKWTITWKASLKIIVEKWMNKCLKKRYSKKPYESKKKPLRNEQSHGKPIGKWKKRNSVKKKVFKKWSITKETNLKITSKMNKLVKKYD